MNGNNDETLRPLGGYLKTLYADRAWHGQWNLFLLVRKWETIVGPDLAKVTMPAYFRHDVLWMYVENSAWMQHVQLLKMKLLEQVNSQLSPQSISDLRWLLKPVGEQVPRSLVEPRQQRKISPQREKAFEEMVSTVEDEECRQALLQLWKSYERDGT